MRRLATLLTVGCLVWPAMANAQELPTTGSWFGDTTSAASRAGHLAVVQESTEGVAVRLAEPGAALGPPLLAAAEGRAGTLAVADDGGVLFVWATGRRGYEAVRAVFRPPGGSFGAPILLGDDPPSAEEAPAAGFDAQGRATVLWSGSRAGGRIYVRTRAADGTWSAPHLIRAPGAFRPSMHVNAAGVATALWRQNAPGGPNRFRLVTATRPADGRFGRAQIVAGTQRDTDLGVVNGNDRGDTVIAWSQDSGRFRSTAYAVFRTAGGRFGRPERVSRIRDDANGPSVSIDAAGRTMIAWSSFSDGLAYVRVRSASGRLLAVQRLSKRLGTNGSVRALALGAGLVTWYDDTNPELFDGGSALLRVAVADGTGRFRVRPVLHRFAERDESAPQPHAVPGGFAVVAQENLLVRGVL